MFAYAIIKMKSYGNGDEDMGNAWTGLRDGIERIKTLSANKVRKKKTDEAEAEGKPPEVAAKKEQQVMLCTNCGIVVPDNFKLPLCKDCRKHALKLLISGGAALAVGGGVAYGIGKLAEIEQTPKLPDDDYNWILKHQGKENADWISGNVKKGVLSVDYVESHIMTKREYSGYTPTGCRACGGNYPLCRMGCNLYDD